MGRKVSVGLEADVAGFIRPVDSAKKSVDDLGDKVDSLDRSLNKIPPDAAKAGAALKLLDGDAKLVGRSVNDLGEKSTGLAVLDARIREAQKEVRKLADEFQRTGDIDVFKKLGDASGKLNGLQEVRKKLKDAVVLDGSDAVKATEGFFKRLVSRAEEWGNEIGKMLPAGIAGALANPVAGPIIAAGLIAALVAAATTVLASAGGIVLAAGGAGAVGAGIMGALMGDPEVTGAAWKHELSGIKDEFLSATSIFRGPLIDAAHLFGSVLGGINFDKIFGRAATYLPELAAGAAAFARWIGIAAEYLTDGAAPIMKVISQELPKIGHAIATASKSIADGGEGGAQALKDLFTIIEIVIAGLGGMIGAAEKAYTGLAAFRDAIIPRPLLYFSEQLLNTGVSARSLGSDLVSTVDDLEKLSGKLNATAVSADSLAGAMVGKIFSATMGMDQAVLGVAESLTRLDETMDKNGKAIDKHTGLVAMNTEKGQANREGVLAAVTANMSMYQSQLAVGMSAEDAAAAYDVNTAALEKQLRQAGLTGAQVDDLVGKYRGVPKKVDTDIAMHGLTDAIDRLNETIRLINGLHDKTITITVKQVGDNPQGQSRGGNWATGGIRRAAVGMILPPSDPGTVLAAEPQTGGEALIPLQGISRGRAMSLMQQVGAGYGLTVSAGGAGGGGRVVEHRHVVDIMGGGELIRRLVVTDATNRGQSVGTFLGVSA